MTNFREIAEKVARGHMSYCRRICCDKGRCECGRDAEVDAIEKALEEAYRKGYDDSIDSNEDIGQ